jgi:hypothetical protein
MDSLRDFTIPQQWAAGEKLISASAERRHDYQGSVLRSMSPAMSITRPYDAFVKENAYLVLLTDRLSCTVYAGGEMLSKRMITDTIPVYFMTLYAYWAYWIAAMGDLIFAYNKVGGGHEKQGPLFTVEYATYATDLDKLVKALALDVFAATDSSLPLPNWIHSEYMIP